MQSGSTASKITVLPVWTGDSFAIFRPRSLNNLLEMRPAVLVTRGALAMKLALLSERIGQGDEVLVPAFHCPSMIEPVVAVGAVPVFYGITEDLRVDLPSIRRGMSKVTRAVLAPHFFGRIQDLRELHDLCANAGAVLIEDCAHAITGAADGRNVGVCGDYVIASPRKFVPVGEGGFLAGARMGQQPLPATRRTPLQRNIRIAFDMCDRAVAAGRMPLMRGLLAGLKKLRSNPAAAVPAATQAKTPEANTQIAKELMAMEQAAAITRALLSRWDLDRAADARRKNYGELAGHIEASAGYRLLQSSLPLSQAPYMLPVLLSDPSTQFARIKRSDVPVWRWEQSQLGICKVTDHYAQALIQVPCHQSLSPSDVLRIADVFRGS